MLNGGWKKDKFDSRDRLYKTIAPEVLPTIIDLNGRLPRDQNGALLVRNQGRVGCYDDQTEVLTKDGWKLFKDATLDDSVATLRPDGYLEYQKPTHKFESHYQGSMYTMAIKGCNFSVTPNHNMLVKKWDESARKLSDKLEIVTAEKLGWFSAIPRTAKWQGEPTDLISIQKGGKTHDGEIFDVPIAEWFWFMGIYLAEGCVSHYTTGGNYRIEIAAVVKRKREIIASHLKKLPWIFGARKDRFIAQNKNLWNLLEPLGQVREKHIPQYIKDATPELLRTFLDAFILGDGHVTPIIAQTKSITHISTSSKRLADDLQEVILKTGAIANISIIKGGRNAFIKGRKIISRDSFLLIIKSRSQSDIERKKNLQTVDYDGFVYCFEVPNHTLYVRRNGQPMWCGNSCTGHGIGANLCSVAVSLGIWPMQAYEWFSPTWIYNGARFIEGTLSQDLGAYPKDCLDWLLANGMLLEHFWPYDPIKLDKTAPGSTRMAQAVKYPDFAYERAVDGVTGILSALNDGHLVSLGAPWFAKWSGTEVDSTGVLPEVLPGDDVDGGHETIIFKGDQGTHQFFGMNSWGTWGGSFGVPGAEGGLYAMPFSAIIAFKANGGYDGHIITFNKLGPEPPIPPTPPKPGCLFGRMGAHLHLMRMCIIELWKTRPRP